MQIRRIELSIRRWGHKFLNRIFTQNEQNGAPTLNITGRTADTLRVLAGDEAKVFVSLSDDGAATAFVVIEK